jgi:hypothetical protein
MRAAVCIRPVFHTTKAIRRHKQQSDHSEKPGELVVGVSCFYRVSIGEAEQTELVAMWTLGSQTLDPRSEHREPGGYQT